MKQYYYLLKDFINGKPLVKRSSQWPKVRAEHLKNNPVCIVCGGKKNLEVHHIFPFSKYPELELAKHNLETMCESKKRGLNCHLYVGHAGDYRDSNGTYFEACVSRAQWILGIQPYER